jgi:hypothetical protein
MQSGEPKHAWICPQQFCAMQSPHAEPSLGHWLSPQKPAMHWPLQHESGSMHGVPSCWHWPWQTPPTHELLQQSENVMHPAPSG